ncbi:MAG: plasmid mobilization relaxosome protein MobC [Enterococcus sp.]|nr:plasmid mobilization relaxosome protein MobC [Enterococcus sp.]
MEKQSVSQNQTKYIQFRISEEHYQKLETSAKTYGLSPNLYVKKLAQKAHLKKPYFEHAQAKQMLVELTRQGTNLNQIAKKLNQLDQSGSENKELIEALRYTYGVLAQTQKGYQALWQQLRK